MHCIAKSSLVYQVSPCNASGGVGYSTLILLTRYMSDFNVIIQQRSKHRVAAERIRGNWQSPVIMGAGTVNTEADPEFCRQFEVDYKRTIHASGAAYEERFMAQYLDGVSSTHGALLCSSGMSALLTCLVFSKTRIDSKRPVLADSGLYHETKFLLTALFEAERVVYVDLACPEALIEALERHQPALVILEPQRPTAGMEVLDCALVFREIERRSSSSMLIIDDSSTFSAPELVELAAQYGLTEQLLIAASLLKLHQYGLDLVASGIIVAARKQITEFGCLTTCRTHFGTNISEDAAVMLPEPNAQLFSDRMAVITRNSAQMSRDMAKIIDDKATVMSPWCNDDAVILAPSSFSPFFSLSVAGWNNDRYRSFIARAIELAEEQGVLLHAGTSFGFDITRIYLIESKLEWLTPFLRISPGMEDPEMTERLATLLSLALCGELCAEKVATE